MKVNPIEPIYTKWDKKKQRLPLTKMSSEHIKEGKTYKELASEHEKRITRRSKK